MRYTCTCTSCAVIIRFSRNNRQSVIYFRNAQMVFTVPCIIQFLQFTCKSGTIMIGCYFYGATVHVSTEIFYIFRLETRKCCSNHIMVYAMVSWLPPGLANSALLFTSKTEAP